MNCNECGNFKLLHNIEYHVDGCENYKAIINAHYIGEPCELRIYGAYQKEAEQFKFTYREKRFAKPNEWYVNIDMIIKKTAIANVINLFIKKPG